MRSDLRKPAKQGGSLPANEAPNHPTFPRATASGYSGTPLAKKLGIKPASRVCMLGEPDGLRVLLDPLPESVVFQRNAGADTDIAHLFVTDRDELEVRLKTLRTILGPQAVVWVSWPKNSSGVPTTVTEDSVRELALPLGFVDVKVCAVTEVWSGLKLVVRKALR
jgi:hypothetical protein